MKFYSNTLIELVTESMNVELNRKECLIKIEKTPIVGYYKLYIF